MPAYGYLVAVVAFIFSLGFNAYFIRLARRRQWFTPPVRPRDEHQTPTPRIGGIALVLAFLLTIALLLAIYPDALHFTDRSWYGIDWNLLGLLLAILWLSVINVFDDFRGLSWPIKLVGQIIAAVIIAGFGILIPTLSNPFGASFVLGTYSGVLAVIWLVVISNVINWLDSINGVAGGVSSITLIILFLLSISVEVNQPANGLLALIGAGVTLGFLWFNLRGRVFLGDTGSMFLGFLIGVLAIISGGKVATVFLILSIPFLDALVVFITRLINHRSPFLPDRRHLIHRLLDRGLTKAQIVGLFYAFSFTFGLIALNTQTIGKFWAVLIAMAVMAGMVLLYSSQKTTISSDDKQRDL